MLYSTIITEICSQLGDPDKDTYEDRAKLHFGRAVSYFIDAGEYGDNDLPAYRKLETGVQFTNTPLAYDLSSLGTIARVENIFIDPSDDTLYGITVQMVDSEQVARISAESILRPTASDIWIYKVGTTLYLVQAPVSDFDASTDTLFLIYILDPQIDTWVDNTVVTDKLSMKFINKCIERAVVTLIDEDIKRSGN